MDYIRTFHDKDQANAHEVFVYWCNEVPDAFFLIEKAENLLHKADCPHPKNMPSLGKKRKICARTILELENWAKSKRFHFRPCKTCEPYEHSSNIVSKFKYNRVLENIDKHLQLRSDLTKDIVRISRGGSGPTTKRTLIEARIGQGKFRSDVLKLWGFCCAVTGASTERAIRASHIKPWSKSTNSEKLDPKNGLPLVANLDALFDAGLIAFNSHGTMIISPELSPAEKRIFGIVGKHLRKKPSAETKNYLAYHKTNVFHD